MNGHAIRTLAIVVSLSSCAQLQNVDRMINPATDEPAKKSYTLEPYCTDGQPRMRVDVSGFELGTKAFVTVGGAPPYDIEVGLDDPVADFAWSGGSYGIYIRTPDGKVVVDSLDTFAGC